MATTETYAPNRLYTIPVEEAEALYRLMQDHKYRQNDLAGIVSKSEAYISETLISNQTSQRDPR